jgi:hypothetical protein
LSLKTRPLLLFISVIITTAAGFILKYFDLDTFLIFLGFRFHISCVLPLIIIFRTVTGNELKQFFTNPSYKNNSAPILVLLIPLLFTAVLYLTGYINISDPEYFYEFGLSSIVDYPVYLIWNFINLSALFIYLRIITKNAFVIFILIVVLFSFEFFPFDLKSFNYTGAAGFLFISLSAALFIRYFSNIYWFAVSFFTILWSAFLLFGSSSETIVRIIFASKYDYWEGFFHSAKALSEYLIPGYFFISLLVISLFALFYRKRSNLNTFSAK